MDAPKHIAIILDGNRRYAKKHGLKPWEGHNAGKENVMRLLEWAKELGIQELTLYTFSMQNFNRVKDEVDHLMGLFVKAFNDFKDDKRIENVKIDFIGRTERFPEKVREAMASLMEKTRNNQPYKVNFAMAYGGREEVTDSVKRIAEKVKDGELDPKDIDEKVVQENLYLQSEPELVIRTSGELRMSNFLIWQANYAELYFCDKMWPEFTKQDLIAAIEEYKNRKRRFGK